MTKMLEAGVLAVFHRNKSTNLSMISGKLSVFGGNHFLFDLKELVFYLRIDSSK
jgi:hypothetical protein